MNVICLSVAVACVAFLTGCVSAEKPSQIGGQAKISPAAGMKPTQSQAYAQGNAGESCRGRNESLAISYAAAAKVALPAPVACVDLAAFGNLVAGCETGIAHAMARQPLTCAALKPTEMWRYPACAASGLAISAAAAEKEEDHCDALPRPPPPVPDIPVEIGSPDGPTYIYKSNDLTVIRTILGDDQRQISTQRNSDGTVTVDTPSFTATYGADDKLNSVTWK